MPGRAAAATEISVADEPAAQAQSGSRSAVCAASTLLTTVLSVAAPVRAMAGPQPRCTVLLTTAVRVASAASIDTVRPGLTWLWLTTVPSAPPWISTPDVEPG